MSLVKIFLFLASITLASTTTATAAQNSEPQFRCTSVTDVNSTHGFLNPLFHPATFLQGERITLTHRGKTRSLKSITKNLEEKNLSEQLDIMLKSVNFDIDYEQEVQEQYRAMVLASFKAAKSRSYTELEGLWVDTRLLSNADQFFVYDEFHSTRSVVDVILGTGYEGLIRYLYTCKRIGS